MSESISIPHNYNYFRHKHSINTTIGAYFECIVSKELHEHYFRTVIQEGNEEEMARQLIASHNQQYPDHLINALWDISIGQPALQSEKKEGE